MSDFLPTTTTDGALLPSRLARRTRRELERREAQAVVARRADALRVDRIAETASRAQGAVAYLSTLELVHAQGAHNPLTEARLRQITDTAALGLSKVVLDAGS